jgi:two-component system LytT family sensor kinase
LRLECISSVDDSRSQVILINRLFLRLLVLMKRLGRHIIFWLVYLAQDILLQYTWNMHDRSLNDQFWRAVGTALIVLPPKLLVVYYFIYQMVPKMGHVKTHSVWFITKAVLVFVGGLFIFRLLGITFVAPLMYNIHEPADFFYIRDMLVALLQIGYVTSIAVAVKFACLRQESMERDKLLIKEKLETELKFLRNQTNPHFLMNTLNNIYALARKKSDDAPEAILKLSDLLQFILYKSTSPFISLAEEVDIIEHYLKLEELRYTDRLNICFRKKIDGGPYQISPLLLLPFVENAFKHGVSETRFETFIHIILEVEKGKLHFNIENSKERAEMSDEKEKIGLCNVRRQLELTYSDFKLEVINEENTFKVQLSIDLYQHVEF